MCILQLLATSCISMHWPSTSCKVLLTVHRMLCSEGCVVVCQAVESTLVYPTLT